MNYNKFSELYHHGIKGQRWGIRRFENEDGTLTLAGKRRYLKNEYKQQLQNHSTDNSAENKQHLKNIKAQYKKDKAKLDDEYRGPATIGKTLKGGAKGAALASVGTLAVASAISAVGIYKMKKNWGEDEALKVGRKISKTFNIMEKVAPIVIGASAVAGSVHENNKPHDKK